MLELVRLGNGWNTAIIGMGAVFASLILLIVYIKIFAAILQGVEKRKKKKESEPQKGISAEASPDAAAALSGALSEDGEQGELAAAVAVALARESGEDELAAAVTYAIHNFISGETATYAFPAQNTGGREGTEASAWRIAGRMRLMGSRSRSAIRGGNL